MSGCPSPTPGAPPDRDSLAAAFRRILRPSWDDRLELDTLDKQVRACVLVTLAYHRERHAPVLDIRARRERSVMTGSDATSHMHGREPGPTAYACGCRCDECRDLHRERMAAVRAGLAQRPREEVPHGTVSGYRNWNCRCEPCGAAHRAACRAWRESRKAALQAGGGA